MLQDKLKKLAELNIVEEELKAYAEKSLAELEETPAYKRYQEDKEEVAYIGEKIAELRSEIVEYLEEARPTISSDLSEYLT